jgi:hypothetical protein
LNIVNLGCGSCRISRSSATHFEAVRAQCFIRGAWDKLGLRTSSVSLASVFLKCILPLAYFVTQRTAMDKLSTEEQAELKKCSADRLRHKLVQAGVQDTEVAKMDRQALLNAVAELRVVELSGATGDATSGDPVEMRKPVEMWQREMELRERELALREAELMQRETGPWIRTTTGTRDTSSAWKSSFREEERWKAEMAIRERELDLHLRAEETRRNDDRSLLGRKKNFPKPLKTFFLQCQLILLNCQVILTPLIICLHCTKFLLTYRANCCCHIQLAKLNLVVSKLSLAELNSYDSVKSCILREFQITPRELRSRFVSATKKVDESYNIFRGRLEMSLRHYLQSRNVDNFAKLLDLFVADKLKECLSPGALHYVLSLEGNKCFTSNDVASNADVYYSNYNEDGLI